MSHRSTITVIISRFLRIACLVILGWLAVAAAPETEGPLRIEARPVFGPFIRDNVPIPLAITVRGGTGRVLVTAEGRPGYREERELPSSAGERRFVLSVYADPERPDVRVRARDAAGAVAEGAVAGLRTIGAGEVLLGVAGPSLPEFLLKSEYEKLCLMALVEPELLPASWKDYRILDALLFAAGPEVGLGESQKEALAGWVESGGEMIILEEAISAFPQFAWNTDIPGSDMCRVVTRGMGSIMVISKRAIADFPGEVRNGLSHRRTEAAALGMGEVLAAAFPPSRWQDLLIRRSLVLVAAYAAVVLLGIGYYRQGGNRRKLFACAGILAAGFAVVAGVIGLMSHQERWGLLTVIRGKCGEKSFHVLHGIVMSSSGVGDPVYVDHTDNAPLPVFSRDAPESPDRLWGGVAYRRYRLSGDFRRWFGVWEAVARGGSLSAEWKGGGVLALQNGIAWNLEEGVVVWAGRRIPVGDIPRGQSREINIKGIAPIGELTGGVAWLTGTASFVHPVGNYLVARIGRGAALHPPDMGGKSPTLDEGAWMVMGLPHTGK
ncbi:MAG: hypothetical protein V1809_05965 [Planctomycetota bacterium]